MGSRTDRSLSLLAVLFVVVAAACSSAPSEPGTGGSWVGTVTTEGNVTTVVNESGSVWGGKATLVEELSIGVEVGEDAYMLGTVMGLGISDGRFLVLDMQVPIIRVYDMQGRHVADYGGEGDGPGEFRQPDSLVTTPDGRIFVRDPRAARINEYAPDGTPVATYKMAGGFFTSTPLAVSPDGIPYSSEIVERIRDGAEWITGMRAHGADGPYGGAILPPRPDYEPQLIISRREDGSPMNTRNVPFTGNYTWVMTPNGSMIGGYSGSYEFDIRSPEGAMLHVVRHAEAVPVDPDEAAWQRRLNIAIMRRRNPGWQWNGNEIPATKHAYDRFLPGQNGELWVQRPGPGERLDGCTEEIDPNNPYAGACWRDTMIIDAFDAEGRYLGEIDLPEGFAISPAPLIRGSEVWAAFYDEAGTPMVKRYRLVPPD